MTILVPVYDDYLQINFPDGEPEDRLDQLAIYCHDTASCPYCRCSTVVIPKYSEDPSVPYPQYLRMCGSCGFWFARGTREYAHGPGWGRFMLGKARGVGAGSAELDTEQLIRHINKDPSLLPRMNPFKAEDVVVELLKDYLDADVRKLGGRRDGGIDAFVVKGDAISTLIQVKWRQDTDKAEGVKVVRDVAGTQLIQGIPRSLVVTTRRSFSKQAVEEVTRLGDREVVGVGRISMDLKTYSDVLSMLEITTRRITDEPRFDLDFGELVDLFWDTGLKLA